MAGRLRLRQAAELLDVSLDALERWTDEGRLHIGKTDAGVRTVSMAEVVSLIAERSRSASERPIVTGPVRNRFRGVVTRIERDRVAALVEIVAGPHTIVSMLSAEAIDAHGLAVGDEAIAVVKATSVSVEVPSSG